MRWRRLHRWDVAPKEAIRLQEELRSQVVRTDAVGPLRYVAGADAAFSRSEDRAWGAVVVFEYPSLVEVERRWAVRDWLFPYVPGLLSFREIPVLMAAFESLRTTPDLVLFDGQGVAHPRRLGLASHAGLILDVPTIGCAKSRLVGEAEEPGPRKGDWTPLVDRNEVVAAVLRTRDRVRPLYVSTGHRVGLETAVRLVLACLDRTRIPKPTREAHRFVAEVKRAGASRAASAG